MVLKATPLGIATALCFATYVVIVTSVAPSYSGDTPDYLTLALGLCGQGGHPGGFSYMRGLGYPAFLCIASGGLSYVPAVFYVQTALFLAALALACRDLTFGSQLSTLVVAAAAIPHYAYLQKLIYTDGVTVSLVLLYLVFLARQRRLAALLTAVALASIKILFAFLLAHFFLLWLIDRHGAASKPRLLAAGGAVGTAVFIFAHLYLFPSLAYMVAFQRPLHDRTSISIDALLPREDLRFRCGGAERSVAFEALDFTPVTGLDLFAAYGPLSQRDAEAFACSARDIREIEIGAVLSSWQFAPGIQAYESVKYFLSALIGQPLINHLSDMLFDKGYLWADHAAPGSLYDEVEIGQIRRFEQQGAGLHELDRPAVFPWAKLVQRNLEIPLRVLAVVMLVASLWRAHRRERQAAVYQDRVVWALGAFVLGYAFILAVSAVAIVDRYTFVNFLVLCLLAVRVCHLCWARSAPPAITSPVAAKNPQDDRNYSTTIRRTEFPPRSTSKAETLHRA